LRFSPLLFSLLLTSGICFAQQTAAPLPQPSRQSYLKLAAEVDNALHKDVLDVWFPRSVDYKNGGFHSHFGRDWRWESSDGKFSVFQGRMTWVAAQVVLRYPNEKDKFLPIVRHGEDYLQNVMRDKQDGGFFWGVDDAGKISREFSDAKNLYGISFCIYGAAAAYQANGNPKTLALAQEGFQWIDAHAHDATNGGYFESLKRDGTPVTQSSWMLPGVVAPLAPPNTKTMNTHIHLLESFTQLYQVWPDPLLRARLEELLVVVRDKIAAEPGIQNLYFTNDWKPTSSSDSYGHDVETAYLLLEADELLHHHASEKTERMARMLVDHALANGWDATNGGFYGEGPVQGKADDTNKEWWVEVEGLNALLMMHERYGKQTDVYFQRFLEQWHYIQLHQIDAQNGGLYNLTRADGTPLTQDKGEIWKGAYHDGRGFMNVSERLRKLAGE